MATDTIGLLIPQERIARVIGKGGNGLRQIRELCGCQVQVVAEEADLPLDPTDPTVGFRRVNLIGAPEQLASGVDCAIRRAWAEPTLEVSLRIPVEWAGRVVGKGGENLRRAREECGVRIQLERDPVVDRTTSRQERAMTMEGEAGKLHQALSITLSGGLAMKAMALGNVAFGAARAGLLGGGYRQLQQQQLMMMMGANPMLAGRMPMGGSPLLGAGGFAQAPVMMGRGLPAALAGPILSQVRAVSQDPEQMQVHLVVAGNLAGAILGKGGEQIKQTAAAAQCRVSITGREPGADRRVVILGTYQQCAVAQQILCEQLIEAARKAGQPPVDTVTVIQLVKKECAGAVIGKGATTLKHIREQSGAQVQLAREEVEGQRPCTIVGSPNQVLHAERLIFDICKLSVLPGA